MTTSQQLEALAPFYDLHTEIHGVSARVHQLMHAEQEANGTSEDWSHLYQIAIALSLAMNLTSAHIDRTRGE